MLTRSLELASAVQAWEKRGGVCAMVTFTVPHRQGQPLEGTWDAIQGCWQRVTSGSTWVRDRIAHGVEGYVRAAEVTWGPRNGWHPHLHLLLFLDPSSGQRFDLAALHRSMFDRWVAAALDRGFPSPLLVGQEAHVVTGDQVHDDLARYFTKAQDHALALGRELTHSQSKRARSAYSTVTPWELLDGVEGGDADALDLWHEYERTSKGRRQITWSQGLRCRLGLDVEARSDEDIAAEELGSRRDDVLLVPKEEWVHLVRNVNVGTLLEVLRRDGVLALSSQLMRLGIAHQLLGEEVAA